MRTGSCNCGNRVYFSNSVCVGCKAVLGRCTSCGNLGSFSSPGTDYRCDQCSSIVHRCINQASGVCNSFNEIPETLCRWCSFTHVIPDLSQASGTRRWAALETAKRQLLVQLEQLRLPPFRANLQDSHPLRFEFLADTVNADGIVQKVTTGHEDGLVVINIAEADSVHRELTRIRLGEPQRTLIGHMRHEIGHYIDWCLTSRVLRDEYRVLFGDPLAVDYDQAMRRHYADGSPHDWANSFVSEYATMHPWEDFAETINVYLDVMAIAATANDQGRAKLDLTPPSNYRDVVAAVLKIVVETSEYNFDLGLQPLLPEKFSAAVMEKLSFVHRLRSHKFNLVSATNPE